MRSPRGLGIRSQTVRLDRQDEGWRVNRRVGGVAGERFSAKVSPSQLNLTGLPTRKAVYLPFVGQVDFC